MPDKLPLFYFRELLEKAHFRQLSEALWLYLLYADLADPKTHRFDCNLSWAAKKFGVSRTTIWKWHEKLKEGGYITNVRRGRYGISGQILPVRDVKECEQLQGEHPDVKESEQPRRRGRRK